MTNDPADSSMDLDDFSTWCTDQIALARVPSLSAAAAVGGQLVFARAFGYADVERARPATTETAYLLASITKPITATAVCRLADAGLIHLDERVEPLLGGPLFTRRRCDGAPSVRQVLQHTSGLGTHYEFCYVDTDGPRRRFARTMERYGTIYCEPGSRYCYSNLGYGVLDEVIRRMTGRPPEQYVRDEVFAPLAMQTALIGPDYVADPDRAAQRYTPGGDVLAVYDMCHRGASAAWMSAADLVRFGLSQAGGPTVLSPSMRKQMTASTVESGAGNRYGLGWGTWHANGHDFVGHSGSMPGVSTRLSVLPAEGVVAAVLTNQSVTDVPGIADEAMSRLLAALLPDYLPGTPATGDDRPRTSGLEGTWAGSIVTYAGTVPLEITLGADGAAAATLAGTRADALDAARAACYPAPDVALVFPVQLPTPDARVRSPRLALNLFRSEERLCGAAMACPDRSGANGRFGNGYSHWCELSQVR